MPATRSTRHARSHPPGGAEDRSTRIDLICAHQLMSAGAALDAHIGGSRSLPESRVVTLRCRPAVVQCVRLPGQEWKGPDNGPGNDEIPEPPDLI